MGRLYTIDHKLLTETPEIRIGDKIYPVDDRQKTVEKVIKLTKQETDDELGLIRQVLELALGKKAAEEIDNANYPFAAQQEIMETVISAMTGEAPAKVEERFRKRQETEAEE